MKYFSRNLTYKIIGLLVIIITTGATIYALKLLPWQDSTENESIPYNPETNLDTFEDYYNAGKNQKF